MDYATLKKSLDDEIYKMEILVEEDDQKKYTALEVLAKLYAIRDCE